MFNLRRVFALWAVVAFFLGSTGLAHAQTPTTTITMAVPVTGVSRDHQDYAGKVLITQINLKDCISEDFFNFTVTLSSGLGLANYGLEVWAGTACDQTTARPPSQTPTCWEVADARSPTYPNVSAIKVPVQRLLSGRTGGSDIDAGANTGGTDSTGGTGGGTTDVGGGGTSSGGTSSGGSSSGVPSECRATASVTAAQPLTIYFMLVNADKTVASQVQYKVTFKLNAPSPPTNVQTGIGENIAPISWDAPTNNTDQATIDGYQLYCDPAPGMDGVIESGIEWDPNILPADCVESTVLKAGARPDDKYKCGTATKTATRANAAGLINNVPYNVSVATTDTYRNVGVIAEPACAKPQPVTGFFEAYRAAGGEGGGGFCSFSRHKQPLLLFTVLGIGLSLVLRRRRAT